MGDDALREQNAKRAKENGRFTDRKTMEQILHHIFYNASRPRSTLYSSLSRQATR